eukprot:5429964-Pleurochrysis_carterae.AAC.4
MEGRKGRGRSEEEKNESKRLRNGVARLHERQRERGRKGGRGRNRGTMRRREGEERQRGHEQDAYEKSHETMGE